MFYVYKHICTSILIHVALSIVCRAQSILKNINRSTTAHQHLNCVHFSEFRQHPPQHVSTNINQRNSPLQSHTHTPTHPHLNPHPHPFSNPHPHPHPTRPPTLTTHQPKPPSQHKYKIHLHYA